MTALLVAIALLSPARALTTTAETSGYKVTGRYDEVVRLCHDFVRAHKNVTCETFGQSPERRPMVALTVGARGKPTLVVQGGIHAGEIDGKDAGFLVLRELVDGKLDGVALDRIRVVFVPVFNVDGHERFGAYNRPNQVGPEQMGWRTTAQNLNLNRDYVKAEAPEMRAMLALLEREDPVVYMDLHVTDGAEFQHDVAVLVSPAAGVSDAPAELAAAASSLRASIKRQLEAQKHLPIVDFYPSFWKHEDPAGGFAALVSTPRFSDAYAAARNRLGILVETHSWKDYATRVRATHDSVVAVLRELSAHGGEWQRAARDADAEPLAGKPLVLAWKPDLTRPRTIDFLGYHYTRTPSPISTATRIVYDTSKPEVWRVPLYDTLVPSVTATLPRAGWFVPRAFAELVAGKLAAHGLVYRDVDGARTSRGLDVDAYRASDVTRRAETFEGRATLQVRGGWSHERRSFAGGGIFVPVAQPHARLAAQLLEPEAPDSLTSWGYFDGVFEQKEYMEEYVLEGVAEKMLADRAVKAEWDAKLKDPAFAKSADARLEFFYRKHPSWDAQLGLVPVYRLQEAP
ncbi:MAG TPA: M14 family zinc carboxypeptidase [Polyangia bacterium]|nr:M14 family zinc carboxypeptidase [Polyangia bacterium]